MIVADLRQGAVYWTETDSVVEVTGLVPCVINERGRPPFEGWTVRLRVLASPEPLLRGAELELSYALTDVVPWDEDEDEVPI